MLVCHTASEALKHKTGETETIAKLIYDFVYFILTFYFPSKIIQESCTISNQ